MCLTLLGRRAGWQAEQVVVLQQALSGAEPDSDRQAVLARALVRAAASCVDGVDAVRGLVDGSAVPVGLSVDQDLRWAALASLSAQDAVTDEELAEELRRDDTMSGRTAHLRAVAARPTEGAKAAAWEAMTGDERLTNDHLRALVAGFSEPSGGVITGQYAERYYSSITDWWQRRSMVMATILARGLFPTGDLEPGQEPADHPLVGAPQTWLDRHPEAPKALRRIVIEQLDHLRRSLRVQAA